MKRFVYAPKIEAFIKAEGRNRLIDISDDIISGSVTRRLNAMSTATLTLQNKMGKYTRQFEPMDRIIIRLSRVGPPTLVFSGYLDESKYYQMYPGPITLTASCTLKLLQNTYFDPGLPFVSFFFEKHGWVYDPQTGIITDSKGAFGNFDTQSGIGEVLYAVLTEIGGWHKDHVIIKKIPNAFIRSIHRAMIRAGQEEEENFERTVKRLRTLLSAEGLADISGIPNAGEYTNPVRGSVNPVDVARYARAAGFRGDDLVVAVAVAWGESGLKANAVNDANTNGTWDAGLWQINEIHGYTQNQLFDPAFSARAAYRIYQGRSNTFNAWVAYTNGRYRQFLDDAQRAVNKLAGTVGSDHRRPDTVDAASAAGNREPVKAPVYPVAIRGTNLGGPAAHRAKALGGWQSDNAIDIGCPMGTKIIAVDGGTITNTGYGGPMSANTGGYKLTLETTNNRYFYTHLRSIASGIRNGTRVSAGQVLGFSGAGNSVPHLHFAAEKGLYTDSQEDWWFNRPIYVDGTIVVPGDGMGGEPGTIGDVAELAAAIGRQAAFFTIQLQGSDTQLSLELMGKRALANDVSLMEWIKAMVPASGRVFTSHPNGDFYAFFPDYFGYFERTPYFRISDIEVINLEIDRNDIELATHVFASGSILDQSSGITLGDRVTSMVASVQEEAFDYFINVDPENPRKSRGKDKDKHRRFSPNKFLERYGTRPMSVDLPEITHPLLLWMAAWSKFTEQWAKQFRASGEFTFMPELFPGGLVAFGNRITMFIEEVTHTFDRTSGFSTNAQLTAPAALNKAFDLLPISGGSLPSGEDLSEGGFDPLMAISDIGIEEG